MNSQTQPTLFLIRHGEKPAQGDGLSAQGQERADGLRKVFGKESSYNIAYIMAEEPKSGLYSLFYLKCA
jgi:hypothetical protein